MYVRNSQGESESHAAKASHAAAQEGAEGELHKKYDDARAGGAVPMMPRSYHRERGPPRPTIGVGKETCYSSFREIYAMPVYPRGLAFV